MDNISQAHLREEAENERKGTLVSLSLHTLLIVGLFFMPFGHKLIAPIAPPIQVELPKDLIGGGAMLGLPNQGRGSNPSPGKPDPNAGNLAPQPKADPPPPPVNVPVQSKPPVIDKPAPAPTSPPRKVETTEDPNAAIIRQQQAEARKKVEEEKYQQQQAARQKQQQENAARAEAAAKAQAAADEAARQQAIKDKFKGKYGNGSNGGTNGGGGTGTGRGNTGTPGNQGQRDGDPNNSALEGMGRGPGKAEGFGSRGVRSAPRLQENSQNAGKVVLRVCIDADGNVLTANYQASGSTTNNQDLIDAAVRNAEQYHFTPGDAAKTCGLITYNFKVQ